MPSDWADPWMNQAAVAGRKRWWLGVGMVAALGVGWLLSELVHGQTSASPSRIEVDRQVHELLGRRNKQPLSPVDERRLLERLLALGRLPESIVLVEEQVEARPKDWRWRLLLSQLELRNGNTKQAEIQLQKLIQLQPTNVEVLQAQALLRLQQGRPQEAIATVQEALANDNLTNRVTTGLLLADLQRQSGASNAALSTYKKLSKDNPKDARPFMAQALLMKEQGKHGEARQLLATARLRQSAANAETQAIDALAARWGVVTNQTSSPSATAATEPLKESGIPNP